MTGSQDFERSATSLVTTDKLRICIVTGESALSTRLTVENFLPKIDGVTRTLARLLEHLQATGHEALIVGPDNGLVGYFSDISEKGRHRTLDSLCEVPLEFRSSFIQS
jgi:hypothetical protein